LQQCASPRSVATRRGKKVAELFGRRDAAPAAGSGPTPPAAPTQEAPANA
jgi:small subunit ribosomal protein S5